MTVIELKAGQAVVFNNKTLHASPPNTSQETRIAFGLGITRSEAQLRHYFLLPQTADRIEGYEVSREFFLSYNNARLSALHNDGQRPAGLNDIGTFNLRYRRYDTSELEERIRSAGNSKDDSLLERVKGLAGEYAAAPLQQAADVAGESRPLWKIYTPGNIYREIRYRLKSLAN
jgi:hypothetical protein